MARKPQNALVPAVGVERRHGGAIRRMAPEGTHTISEAAELIGVSVDTLRRWRKTGGPDGGPRFVPHTYMEMGTLNVLLYTDEDIAALKQQIKEHGG